MASNLIHLIKLLFAHLPTPTPKLVGTSTGVIAASWAAYVLYRIAWKAFASPLNDLPGPTKFESWIWGNIPALHGREDCAALEEYLEAYGHTLRYRGGLLEAVLETKDPRAIAFILNNAYDFPKPHAARRFLQLLFGNGLLIVEGNDHKRQRKIMNPAFSSACIRDFMPAFYEKAFKLRDIWMRVLQSSSDGPKELDVLVWLNRAALDIIGQVGFDYDFDSLTEGSQNELTKASMTLFNPDAGPPIWGLIQQFIPPLRLIKTERARQFHKSRELLHRVGMKLVADKKATILAAADGSIDKKAVVGNDILTTILKANMANDVKDSERLSDTEVMDQIATMILAGHETSATSLSWLFYDLAKPENQTVQTRLRAELQTLSSPQPTIDELNSLKYLDAVVRENARLNAVVPYTERLAAKDMVLPLSKPFVDKKGVERHEIVVPAESHIVIPIQPVNRDKDIWGTDAREFKPERWLDPSKPPYNTDVPGVYSGLLTFLGGPRACIGWRMALIEIKVLIFVLLRDFAFELPETPLKIEKRAFIVARPTVLDSGGKFKPTMLLRVRQVQSV